MENAVLIIGCICTVLSILFAIITFVINRNHDSSKHARETASISTDIVYIKDGISELKTLVNAQTKEQTQMKMSIAKLEARVDDIEKRVNR